MIDLDKSVVLCNKSAIQIFFLAIFAVTRRGQGRRRRASDAIAHFFN